MRRPLIEIFILLALGILTAAYLNSLGLIIVSGILIVTAVLSMKFFHNPVLVFSIVFSIVIILIGFALYSFEEVKLEKSLLEKNSVNKTLLEKSSVTGTVTSLQKYNAILSNSDSKKTMGSDIAMGSNKILVKYRWGQSNDWALGDRVTLSGTIKAFKGARNPGTFSEKTYYASKNIYQYIEYSEVIKIERQYSKVTSIIGKVRMRIIQTITSAFSKEDAQLLLGLILGDTSELDKEVKKAFRMTGIAHVLAVSGLHFGILYMMMQTCFKYIKMPVRLSRVLIGTILMVFVLISGVSFSALRACFMILIHMLSTVLRRKYDLLNTLGFVALISVLVNPNVIWSVGFQLSFIAVFSIGAFARLKTIYQIKAYEWLVLPLFIQVALTPIMMFSFNRVYVYSLLFNIPVAVLLPFTFTLGILSIIAGRLGFLHSLIVFVEASFLETLRSLAMLIYKLPFNEVLVGSPKAVYILIFYLLLVIPTLLPNVRTFIAHLMVRNKDRAKTVLCCLVILIMVFNISPTGSNKIQLDFLDIGQGDAILIKGEHGGRILIDSGPPQSGLEDILLKQGVTHLEAVFLSHPDADHYSGFKEIANRIRIDRFYYGDNYDKPQVIHSFKQILKSTHFIKLSSGDQLRWEGIHIEIIHPLQSVTSDSSRNNAHNMLDSNNMSLTFLLNYDKQSVLFTGDIEKEVESMIINEFSSRNLNIDILKVAHHGSKTSTTEAFVQMFDPEIAIIQVGKNNFGHPADQTLELLGNENMEVYRTDIGGCIRVKLKNDKIDVSPWLTTAY